MERREPSPDLPPVELSTPRPPELPPPAPPQAPNRPVAAVIVEAARSVATGGYARIRRMTPRMRLVMAGTVLAVLVAVPTAFQVVQRVAYPPEEPVEHLISAMREGDFERAAKLAGCSSALCRAGALREGYQPPTDLTVADVSRNADSAAVRLRYQIAGARQESTILVERDTGWLFRDWRIESGATGYLDVVAAPVKAARVAGTAVSTVPARRTARGHTGAVEALLGLYTVVATADDPLFTAEPATVTVAGDLRAGAVTAVELKVNVKPTVADEVTTQIRAQLDGCAQTTDFAPRKCPFAYHKVIYKPADVRWRIDTYPLFDLQPPDRPAATPSLVVRTTIPGRATVAYTSDGVPQTATVEIEIRGVVYADGSGKIIWAN